MLDLAVASTQDSVPQKDTTCISDTTAFSVFATLGEGCLMGICQDASSG